MWFKGLKVVLVVLFLVGIIVHPSFADERDEEVAVLKAQVQELMQRIDKLEAAQAKSKEESLKAKEEIVKVKETTQAVQAARVDLEKLAAKLKLKGRAAFGFFDSGKAGSYPSGSFEMPPIFLNQP